MIRYGFNIRTKSGQRVDNIQIMAASAEDAERRLRQMYWQCEIVARREQAVAERADSAHPAGPDARIRPPARTEKTGTH